jgi:chorismate synthase
VKPDLEIREIHGVEEGEALIALENRIWGPGEGMNRDLLTAMIHIGALAAGAFTSSGEMVALLLGMPTKDATVQHSHALGVLEEYRQFGLGAKLKWFQREWCLARGITTVQWTYDPLRVANAKLNLHKLGARVGVYLENYYGQMRGINAGAPSDRFLAQWDLNSSSVFSRLGGEETAFLSDLPRLNTVTDSSPNEAFLNLEQARISFEIPADFPALQASYPGLALEWREHCRAVFNHYFPRGYRITDFDANTRRYLLEVRA